MRARSAIDAVSPALDHTKRQLLPFQWGQWWRLAVLGIATAELSGAGCQSNFRGTPDSNWGPGWLAFEQWNLPLIATIVAAGLVVVGAALMLLLYVNSVCRFVLIDAVISRRCEGIRSGWSKWRVTGRRYFRWQLLYHTTIALTFAIVIGVPACGLYFAGWFVQPQDHVAGLILTGLALALVLAVGLVAAVVVYVVAKDFLAPIMAVSGLAASDAWPSLIEMMKSDKAGFAGYLGLKFLLSVAVAIVFFCVALLVFVPLLITAVVANIGLSGLGSDMASIGAFAAVLGVGALLLFVLLTLLGVPLVVFFPASALYFLASRYPPLGTWLEPSSPEHDPVSPASSAVPRGPL